MLTSTAELLTAPSSQVRNPAEVHIRFSPSQMGEKPSEFENEKPSEFENEVYLSGVVPRCPAVGRNFSRGL